MKNLTLRYFRDLLLCAAMILSVNSLVAEPATTYRSVSAFTGMPQETVVYVTNTGKKYHRGTCRYLSQSKIKTTVKKAKEMGNGACKVCRP